MAHIEQQDFCNSVKDKYPSYFKNVFVLDIGSLDINGNNKVIFDDAHYLGLDVALGRNVDIVSKGHELSLPDETFDTIISTECFEHDQYYSKTIKNIYRMLKPGGLFVFTCATTGRPEHGTRRTTPEDAPLLQGFNEWSDYYKNLTEEDIREVFVDIEEKFESFEFSIHERTCDLYFWGIKSGIRELRDNYSFLRTNDKYKEDISEIKETLNYINNGIIKDLNNINSELIKDLSDKNTLLLEKINEVSEIKSSTSWAVTAPLRALGSQVKVFSKLRKLSALVIDNPYVCVKAVKYLKSNGLKQTFRRLKFASTTVSMNNHPIVDLYSYDNVYILTTKHCQYIADLIQSNLEKVGVNSQIIYSKPKDGFSSTLHFVICPQIFDELPGLYIAYQMEQSVSSRWFTDSYFQMLNSAYAIFDYSEINLKFLQNNGVSLKNLYFMPIGQASSEKTEKTKYEYDVLFYGDINNKRRQDFIEALSSRFKVKVVSDLFGEELHREFALAKVIVNIHYYEGALLESTRIYECLSHGKMIVSETSVDIDSYEHLTDIVDFVDVGDINGMIDRVSHWLDSEERLDTKNIENIEKINLLPDLFEYYFMRFLLANDWLTFDKFYDLAGHNIRFDNDFVCLGLPESVERHHHFNCDNKYNIDYFPGLKHRTGWIGCGLSYKFLLRKAKECGFEQITICEDDVDFPVDFEERYSKINEYLKSDKSWGLFSGLIADLNTDTTVSKVVNSHSEEFVYINKMTSTVLNVYSNRFYDSLLGWDESNRCAETNTIDRYIENSSGCNVITTGKFLVGHKEELDSTLWGFNNSVYLDLISNSSSLLNEKKNDFLTKAES